MTEPTSGAPQSEPTTYNLLFVCTGNTCRSPMAEAIARHMVAAREWTHVAVGSAGIAAGNGAPAAENAIRAAGAQGLDLAEHRSRTLTPELVAWADLILVMSHGHLGAVAELGGGEKVALVTDFAAGEEVGRPVEDPFGADETAYRRTYAELEQAVGSVLARLETILAP